MAAAAARAVVVGSSGDDGSGTGSDGGSSGTDGSGSSGGSDPGSGDDSGDSGSGSSPDPAMYDFTDVTYNAALHDYNGDGLVDDSNGDGVPDDRDGDGFPDGLLGAGDLPRSAGPGFMIPPSVSMCFGYNGNLVVQSSSFQRGRTYYLDADDSMKGYGFALTADDYVAASANAGPLGEAPIARFAGDFTEPNFPHTAYEADRNGYVLFDLDWNRYSQFRWKDVDSCLIPPWLNP